MIPYITNRGGPMVGLEALSMQGLPVDKLLLTRETEDQLADLAGNAMSTTVVGACILAALVTGKKLLKAGHDSQTYEDRNGKLSPEKQSDSMDIDVVPVVKSSESRVVGEDRLQKKSLDLSIVHSCSYSELLADAEKSKRLCSCEGRMDMTSRPVFTCQDCGNSSCKKCGGRPEHNPVPVDVIKHPRTHPSEFAKRLKATLPMCIILEAVDQSLLDNLRKQESATIPDSVWSKWKAAVIQAANSEFRFVELKRQETWSVVYQSTAGVLELSLYPHQPEWRLFAFAAVDEPANADIRQVLQSPVGRFNCTEDILKGNWQFALPCPTVVSLKIQGLGELVPSWEARLGLVGEEFKNKMVFPELRISLSESDIAKLDRDISGVYVLLDKCGTANGALHKKIQGDPGDFPIFMLFDPHRTNDSEDCFVFSSTIRRLEYQECRPIFCKVDPSWRQSSKDGEQTVAGRLPFKWTSVDPVKLKVGFLFTFEQFTNIPQAFRWA